VRTNTAQNLELEALQNRVKELEGHVEKRNERISELELEVLGFKQRLPGLASGASTFAWGSNPPSTLDKKRTSAASGSTFQWGEGKGPYVLDSIPEAQASAAETVFNAVGEVSTQLQQAIDRPRFDTVLTIKSQATVMNDSYQSKEDIEKVLASVREELAALYITKIAADETRDLAIAELHEILSAEHARDQNREDHATQTEDALTGVTSPKAPPAPDCEWMFGDAATGLLGFHALADLNPLRWSGSRSIPKAIEDLRKVQQHGDRPIILKVPSGVRGTEVNTKRVVEAINYLEAHTGSMSGLAEQTTSYKRQSRPSIQADPTKSLLEKLRRDLDTEDDTFLEMVRVLFEECDENRSGILEYESEECRMFIVKFFDRYGLPPPDFPLVVFKTVYNEVKQLMPYPLPEYDGLDMREAVQYAKRIHAMILDFKGEMKMQQQQKRKSRLLSINSMKETMDGRTAKSPSITGASWQTQEAPPVGQYGAEAYQAYGRSRGSTSAATDCFPEINAAQRGSVFTQSQRPTITRDVSPRTALQQLQRGPQSVNPHAERDAAAGRYAVRSTGQSISMIAE
jgi:hypothetical protein